MSHRHVHIFGAAGSGSSTLGVALARDLQCRHFEINHFFWMPTDPPHQAIRPRPERLKLLGDALASSASWTLSGSLCGWGDSFIAQFDLVVFLRLPTEVRLRRIAARQAQRHGQAAISPGGKLHVQHQEILQSAAAYDTGGLDTRSLQLDEHWLAGLSCPVVRLEGDMPTDAQVKAILGHFDRP
jgi:adenylate kinase family enzyme